ncbi:MAG: ATP-dependent helicase [Lachnospiraceae bacterium]|nr:ATP-dependent helicase [Lachnospiraceae bacterium]
MSEQMNNEQRRAVMHLDGPMMVLAGPGSGKTFVITRRIRNMIQSGIAPESILVITFTKAAAVEMQERFESLMDDEISGVTFGTFHGIYFNFLKKSLGYSASDIVTEKEKRRFIKEALSSYPMVNADDFTMTYLLDSFSKIKNDGIEPERYESPCRLVDKENFEKIYYDYAEIMRIAGKIDFDDMVLKCWQLFSVNPEILEMWRARFKYILIDEFQDINPMQYEVIRMLAAPLNNLFIVGDDDQSIYGFRGSCPQIMLDFPKEFKGAESVLLKYNYRSIPEVVNTACKLIGHNKNRFKKTLMAANKGNGGVNVLAFKDKKEETEGVINLVKTGLRFLDRNDIALIFRTNSSAGIYAKALSEAGIQYYMREKIKNIFYGTIAKDLMAVLAYANGKKTRENLLRFMNKPVRYIRRCDIDDRINADGKGAEGRGYEGGKGYLRDKRDNAGRRDFGCPGYLICMLHDPEIKDYVKKNVKELIYHLDTLCGMHPFAGMNYIRKVMGYEAFMIKENEKRGIPKDETINELDEITDSAKNTDNYLHWLESIEEYEESLKNAQNEESRDGVQLMTMHGSKGLEYRMVIIPDMNEGNIPSKKCEKPAELEEERRVFYVAMTRAKEKLFLCHLEKNREKRITPSRFLKEI